MERFPRSESYKGNRRTRSGQIRSRPFPLSGQIHARCRTVPLRPLLRKQRYAPLSDRAISTVRSGEAFPKALAYPEPPFCRISLMPTRPGSVPTAHGSVHHQRLDLFGDLFGRLTERQPGMTARGIGRPAVRAVRRIDRQRAVLEPESGLRSPNGHQYGRLVPTVATGRVILRKRHPVRLGHGAVGRSLGSGTAAGDDLLAYLETAQYHRRRPMLHDIGRGRSIHHHVELEPFREMAGHRDQTFHLPFHQLAARETR